MNLARKTFRLSPFPAAQHTIGSMSRLTALVSGIDDLSKLQLQSRAQTLVVDDDVDRIEATVASSSVVSLVAKAVIEISRLSARSAEVHLDARNGQIRICGKNPLELPDTELLLDRSFKARASALGIKARLSWDQGVGPCFMLGLPNAT